jgi:hypothetical protein
MASPTPPHPGPERPEAPSRSDHPRVESVVWAVGILCGGLVLLLVALATMGAVDFSGQPVLGLTTLVLALLWLLAMAIGSRAGRRLGFRRADRERRGF